MPTSSFPATTSRSVKFPSLQTIKTVVSYINQRPLEAPSGLNFCLLVSSSTTLRKGRFLQGPQLPSQFQLKTLARTALQRLTLRSLERSRCPILEPTDSNLLCQLVSPNPCFLPPHSAFDSNLTIPSWHRNNSKLKHILFP